MYSTLCIGVMQIIVLDIEGVSLHSHNYDRHGPTLVDNDLCSLQLDYNIVSFTAPGPTTQARKERGEGGVWERDYY